MLVWLLLIYCGFPNPTDPSETQRVSEHMVVTGQLKPESQKESVYQVEVVDRATLDRLAAISLSELMTTQTGLELEQHSVFGTSLSIQGVGQENVKILVDGVPVIGRLNGIIDLNQIALESVQQVEWIKGPVSVFYGTDAMGGVVNLITQEPQGGNRYGLSSYFELDHQWVSSLDAQWAWGQHRLQVQATGRYTEGQENPAYQRKQDWNERNRNRQPCATAPFSVGSNSNWLSMVSRRI